MKKNVWSKQEWKLYRKILEGVGKSVQKKNENKNLYTKRQKKSCFDFCM